mmetsp:Transcript_14014/g.30445  ORF Transcript_14014/g.30445 Transcript_14014/m.30445 type:complete len:102 (+) Transcript_14014:106-411(+)
MRRLLISKRRLIYPAAANMVLSRTYPRLASAASSPPSSSIPRPNRFTAAFNEMKRACPDEMKSYADCVLLGHKAGSLERGTCQQEFDLVKKCFKEVRRSMR